MNNLRYMGVDTGEFPDPWDDFYYPEEYYIFSLNPKVDGSSLTKNNSKEI
jgi:hypothetical protein